MLEVMSRYDDIKRTYERKGKYTSGLNLCPFHYSRRKSQVYIPRTIEGLTWHVIDVPSEFLGMWAAVG